MILRINRYKQSIEVRFSDWAKSKLVGIFVFNLLMMILLLLKSAGYFDPYLPLTINMVYMAAMILAVCLLGANSRVIFLLAMFFWVMASWFGVWKINIWAERSAIYTYQALVFGVILLIIESFCRDRV